MKLRWVLLVVLGMALLGGGWYWFAAGPAPAGFRTALVQRGDLVATISATGTIEPEEVVDIGAQVAGMVKEFGRDPRDSSRAIDYGSEVEVDTVLAQIDDALFQARVAKGQAQVGEAEAQIAQADADIARGQADLLQTQAKFRQADREWERARKLGTSNAISATDSDTMRANFETAQANVTVSEAAIKQYQAARVRAEKTLAAAKADLSEAVRNLSYTTIRSPVKGVIVDRRVNVGQTVLASLNAPSLFLIAKDLKRMQVWASVNEADIGQIHSSQPVRFTVDAFPNEVFRGEVSQIRLNAAMTQNVVTYTVVVVTDNSNGRLLPYLTANVQFELGRRSNVLLAPNAALRWRPQPALIAPDARAAYATAQKRGAARIEAKGDKVQGERGVLWVADGSFVRPVDVTMGLSDGLLTEIVQGNVPEGLAVVLGEARRESSQGTSNPFTPKMFGGGKSQ